MPFFINNAIVSDASYTPSRYPVSSNAFVEFKGRINLPANDYSGMPYQVYLAERRWPNGRPAESDTGNIYYSTTSAIPDMEGNGSAVFSNSELKDWRRIFKEANAHPFTGPNFENRLKQWARWDQDSCAKERIQLLAIDTVGSKNLWKLLLDYYQGKEGIFQGIWIPVLDTNKTPSIVESKLDPTIPAPSAPGDPPQQVVHNASNHYIRL